jgi:hypothetical protein
VGYGANYFNQGGSYNTIIGYEAGRGTSAHSKSGNVFMGYKAGFHERSSNRLYIANSDTRIPLVYGEFDTVRLGIDTNAPGATLDVNGTFGVENGAVINEISTDGTLSDNSDSAVPTEQAVKTYVDSVCVPGGVGVVPVGGVVAWMKSFPNTPSLPDGWVECSGQTLIDSNSPYNGQVIPDLNGGSGTQRFLRGATNSGGTGGSETHQHGILLNKGQTDPASGSLTNGVSLTHEASTLPSYYEVVWIMRVK